MTRSIVRTTTIMIIMLAVLTSAGCGNDAERRAEANFDAINRIWEQYEAALNAGDLDGWMSLWSDNAIQMPPDSPSVAGKEQIRSKYETLFKQYTFKMDITNEEGGIVGNMAFTRTSYTTSVSPKSGGQTFLIKGKALTLFKKQSDGTWKISRDCFNDSAPVVMQ